MLSACMGRRGEQVKKVCFLIGRHTFSIHDNIWIEKLSTKNSSIPINGNISKGALKDNGEFTNADYENK